MSVANVLGYAAVHSFEHNFHCSLGEAGFAGSVERRDSAVVDGAPAPVEADRAGTIHDFRGTAALDKNDLHVVAAAAVSVTHENALVPVPVVVIPHSSNKEENSQNDPNSSCDDVEKLSSPVEQAQRVELGVPLVGSPVLPVPGASPPILLGLVGLPSSFPSIPH